LGRKYLTCATVGHQVGPSGRQVEFGIEDEVTLQIAGTEGEEGAAVEILVGFVESLRRDAADVMFPVACKEGSPVPVFRKALEQRCEDID
jgi:hypothetical protein